MSYFLKRATLKRGLYYQVIDGVYDPETGNARQTVVRSIGYREDLIAAGIEDPEAYCRRIVKEYRANDGRAKRAEIDDSTPMKNLGFFLVDSALKGLEIERSLNLFNYGRNVRYDLYGILRFLVLAQVLDPGSKLDEYSSVRSALPFDVPYSYDQILSGLEDLGEDYASVISLVNDAYRRIRSRDTGHVYFDCTNYYFEIDRPRGDLQKGPSKERRTDPIIGMGLLLDGDGIPLSMRMYPGNQSEKPLIRSMIEEMKEDEGIRGRTIQVADKGLNCGQNIYEAVRNGDGYIYSQSVKQLPDKEKRWVLLDGGYRDTVRDGETVFRIKSCVDDFPYSFQHEGKRVSLPFRQRRVVYWSRSLEEKHLREIDALVEKARSLCLSGAKRSEYGECARYIDFASVDEDGVLTTGNVQRIFDEERIAEDRALCGYNMLITSELDMSPEEIVSAYRNLWRIEETFRILKTDLQIRPVYLQRRNRIYGHFLAGYLAVFLLRYLELVTFGDEVPMCRLIRFIRNFKGVWDGGRFINCMNNRDIDPRISENLPLPLRSKVLSESKVQKILNYGVYHKKKA